MRKPTRYINDQKVELKKKQVRAVRIGRSKTNAYFLVLT